MYLEQQAVYTVVQGWSKQNIQGRVSRTRLSSLTPVVPELIPTNIISFCRCLRHAVLCACFTDDPPFALKQLYVGLLLHPRSDLGDNQVHSLLVIEEIFKLPPVDKQACGKSAYRNGSEDYSRRFKSSSLIMRICGRGYVCVWHVDPPLMLSRIDQLRSAPLRSQSPRVTNDSSIQVKPCHVYEAAVPSQQLRTSARSSMPLEHGAMMVPVPTIPRFASQALGWQLRCA